MRMWFQFTPGDQEAFCTTSLCGANPTFSLNKWKAAFDGNVCPCDSVTGTSNFYVDANGKDVLKRYIGDSTLQGLWLLDDIAFFKSTITFSDNEQMATLAKQRFPGITTAGAEVPIGTVVSWGQALLAPGASPGGSDYACGFIIYNKFYSRIGDSQLNTLAQLAATHVGSSCKQH